MHQYILNKLKYLINLDFLGFHNFIVLWLHYDKIQIGKLNKTNYARFNHYKRDEKYSIFIECIYGMLY